MNHITEAPYSSNRMCRLLGHKVPKGYYNDAPYGKKLHRSTDGIGRKHCEVIVECDRCCEEFTLAKFHDK